MLFEGVAQAASKPSRQLDILEDTRRHAALRIFLHNEARLPSARFRIARILPCTAALPETRYPRRNSTRARKHCPNIRRHFLLVAFRSRQAKIARPRTRAPERAACGPKQFQRRTRAVRISPDDGSVRVWLAAGVPERDCGKSGRRNNCLRRCLVRLLFGLGALILANTNGVSLRYTDVSTCVMLI